MSLTSQLEQKLKSTAAAGPQGQCSLSMTSGSDQLDLDLQALDSMSCALLELRLQLAKLQSCSFDDIKKWAEAISTRITYLLEQVAPLEFDSVSSSAVIRSAQPTQLPDGAVYYELILQATGSSTVTLNRYQAVKGTPGRSQVAMQLTHEVLVKLVNDLIATSPGTP